MEGDSFDTLDPANARPMPLTRRAYKVGGSIAVRLPKDMAEAFGIAAGTAVQFKRTRTGILVEPAEL